MRPEDSGKQMVCQVKCFFYSVEETFWAEDEQLFGEKSNWGKQMSQSS